MRTLLTSQLILIFVVFSACGPANDEPTHDGGATVNDTHIARPDEDSPDQGSPDEDSAAPDLIPAPDLTPAPDTRPSTRCGDGVAQTPEACDGLDHQGKDCQALGFAGGTLRCNTECQLDTARCHHCGNGKVDDKEQCDGSELLNQSCESLGFDRGTLTCTTSCLLDKSGCEHAGCSDGIKDGNEECDGAVPADKRCTDLGFDSGRVSCAKNCTLDTSACVRCGDGVRAGGESCDGLDFGSNDSCQSSGFAGGVLACTADCQRDTSACYRCGDGSINPQEACDGDELGGKTCKSEGFEGGTLQCASCKLDTSACYKCGDEVTNGGEECDGVPSVYPKTCTSVGFDGGLLSCTPTCQFDTSGCHTCGDSVVQGPEQCDSVNLGGETCETLGYDGGSLTCSSSCTRVDTACHRCGDGEVEGPEECDANTVEDQDCLDLGYAEGELKCTDCGIDTSGCRDLPMWGALHYTATSLNATYVTPKGTMWAVGDKGRIVRKDGNWWRTARAPNTSGDLYSISGSSETNIWATGKETVLRYDGTRWRSLRHVPVPRDGRIRAAVVFDDEVFIAGHQRCYSSYSSSYYDCRGFILHYAKGAWSVLPEHTNTHFHAAWGSSSDDVWFGGSGSTLYHFDGTSLSAHTKPIYKTTYAIGGTANSLWAVGDGGTILRYMGAKWISYLGSPTQKTLQSIGGSGDDAIWAVDDDGTILRFDGTLWKKEATTSWGMQGIAAHGDTVYAVGRNTNAAIYAREGGVWKTGDHRPEPTVPGRDIGLKGVWLEPGGQGMRAAGDDLRLLRCTASGCTAEFAPPSSKPETLNAIWGASTGDVWSVGGFNNLSSPPAALRYDDVTWEYEDVGERGYWQDIWGTNADNVWMVGAPGVRRFDGQSWSSETWPLSLNQIGQTPQGIWGSSSTDIWAHSSDRIAHRDNTGWSEWTYIDAPTGFVLNDIWGSADDDVWLVGKRSGGFVLHFDGALWSQVTIPYSKELSAVGGNGRSDVWAGVVPDGEWSPLCLLHFDGADWRKECDLPANKGEIVGLAVGPAFAWAILNDGNVLQLTR
ncbi:MAG: hypothetical protein JRH20_14005 [Deltaproteobacteria bacterium]|nr:hypothetical protein [Deltaproteobacteria bacterium]